MEYYPPAPRRGSQIKAMPRSRYTVSKTGPKNRFGGGWATGGGGATWGSPKLTNATRLRPITQNTSYQYEKTLYFNIPVYNGNAGSTGFVMAGTTANTFNPGLKWTFSATNVYVNNVNGGQIAVTIPTQSQMEALYEQCRLDRVEFKAFWNMNSVMQASGTSYAGVQQLPIIQTVVDLDIGAAIPIIPDTLSDYPNLKLTQMGTAGIGSKEGASVHMKFVPRVAGYGGAANELFLPKSTYLSVDNGGAGQQYGGLLQFLDLQGLAGLPTGNAILGMYTVYVTLHSTWKGQK